MNPRSIIILVFVVILGGITAYWFMAPKPSSAPTTVGKSDGDLAAPPPLVNKTEVSNTENGQAEIKQSTTPVSVGETRPGFTLPDFEGKTRSIAEFDGKVVLLNFWASWCPPCVREMPAFVELQQELGDQGLQIVGVAIDNVEAAQAFADSVGVNYPMMHGQQDAVALSQQYGNRLATLPYSVIIDRQGIVKHQLMGEIHKQEALDLLRPLLIQ